MSRRILAILAVLLGVFLFTACDSKTADTKKEAEKGAQEKPEADKGAADKGTAEEPAANEPAAEEKKFGEVILEEFDEPFLGKMLLPKGAEASMMSDKGGHYKLALTADGMETLYIDYETIGGAESLEKATTAAKWTAPGNAEQVAATTNATGVHVIELKRDSDSKIFVLGFRPDNYTKCWGPTAQLENCKKIIDSIQMPAAK